MRARVYQPARTATSSGLARTRHWVLEFVHETPLGVDPLMGWTSTDDTQAQVRLIFDSREAALAYAREHDVEVTVLQPQRRSPNIRKAGYGENFATTRRGAWTH